MPHTKADHMVDAGFKTFGDESLQHMAFNRQAHARHRGDLAAAPGHHNAHLFGPNGPARGLHALHHPTLDINSGHFAVLD